MARKVGPREARLREMRAARVKARRPKVKAKVKAKAKARVKKKLEEVAAAETAET